MYAFLLTTLVFIFTRWLTFKGFKGSDDLHYAMLASNLLTGRYDPFQPNDIYSGRILLITLQALIYRLGGINTITTQFGTIAVVVVSCYLTVFRLMESKSAGTCLLASALFYFNPVLTTSTVGILPDAYVMFCGILVILLCKRSSRKGKRASLIKGLLTGVLISTSLLFKETALIFLPFIAIISLFGYTDSRFIAAALISFIVMIGLLGITYYHFTGDIFFRLKQIKNSSYFNRCSYDLLPARYLFIRLTYEPWREFIVRGFYPVVLSVIAILIRMFEKKNVSALQAPAAAGLIILLLTALYFPFTLTSYQPLCADARQFLFLLPLAVVITTESVHRNILQADNRFAWLAGSLLVVLVCTISTQNKWQWMIYTLVCIYFLSLMVLPAFLSRYKFVFFPVIVWLSILEGLFFLTGHWFQDLKELNNRITSGVFYFHDNDNMMHWKLLHHFNKGISCYNLEKNPFKVYRLYYNQPDTTTFRSGWLIVNKDYTTSSRRSLYKIDSLVQRNYFSNKVFVGNVSALYVDKPSQLKHIKSILE